MSEPDKNLQTVAQIRAAAAEMMALVDERLPERFYPSEPSWRPVLTATVARIGSLVEGIVALAGENREPEIHVLMRSLYEHVVVHAWVAIDPAVRVREWYGATMRHRRRLHNSLGDYDLDGLMDEEELAAAELSKDLKPFDQMAAEADAYWHARVSGLHVNPPDGPKSVLTLEGLYVVIYRVASRSAHPTLEGLDWWALPLPHNRVLISARSKTADLTYAGLSIPLIAISLVINHYRLGWPSPELVEAINEALANNER